MASPTQREVTVAEHPLTVEMLLRALENARVNCVDEYTTYDGGVSVSPVVNYDRLEAALQALVEHPTDAADGGEAGRP